jgi:hypothetical protein
MYRSLYLFVLFAFTTTAHAEKEQLPAPSSTNDRDLLNLGDLICPNIETVFQNQVECTCDVPIDFALTKTYLDVKCSRQVCDPTDTVCGDVTFGTELAVSPASVAASICIEDIQLLQISLPQLGPFCIDYTTAQAGIRGNVVKSCNIVIAGQKCNSCSPCDRRGGVKFDCSNIVSGFKTKSCARFAPYLGAGSKASSKLPAIRLSK